MRLQKYSGGKLSDVMTFTAKDGMSWKDSAGRDQSSTWKELTDWRGNRADARPPGARFPEVEQVR